MTVLILCIKKNADAKHVLSAVNNSSATQGLRTAEKNMRCRQDSNLRGETPMDF